ncbi:EAL domain-containing protein [Pseudanabaena sp. BC1403]|uniref:two-component system response regulator n=1 Tax=Pseudanabaena sp. BC1403 TaxID=2043171 RepID=UPI000CD8D918|nr:EAL domain-containing protein [Pseudanabaena sp. BC1403]
MNDNKDSIQTAATNSEILILIVDDLPDNLRVLSAAISGQGYQIRCAKSGAIALMAVETTCPDLILLDIKMPDMDGYEVCQRLKASEFRDIPVIFLSALDDVFDKVKAFNIGGADYITKPFQIEEVLIRVKHQLSLKVAESKICQLNQQLEQQNGQLEALNAELQFEIIERQIMGETLKVSEERLESILGSIEDVVWSMHPTASQFIYFNAAVAKIYGYPISNFFEDPEFWLKVIHIEDRDRIEIANRSIMTTGTVSEEYRILRPDQEVRWVSDRRYLVYDRDGKVIRIDGIVRDITDHKRAQDQLVHDALHDSLTGLPNRNLFMDRVEQALKYGNRHSQYMFAVMFIDLDRFKMVNDMHGHMIGDQFLQAIAKILGSCLRSVGDTVARLGGDEFTILIDDIQEVSEALMIADRILSKLLHPINLPTQTIFASASIGIVISNRDYVNSTDLLRDADIAMYRAKSLGKGRYILFDKEMYEQNLRAIQLDSDLHYALEREEFELYYQPIMSLASDKLAGFEALIRWHHPERGLVPPCEFIPIAEETGLIIGIGDWVINQACKQLSIWQSQFIEAKSLKMSINLTCQQIREKNLLEKLDRVLATTGIDGSTIRLEITESSMMDQGEETIAKLEQLRARNIQLSIDDFGQGYSSLSYLHRFPVNTLKIDRTFVEQMSLGGQNFEIIRTIIILAHALDMNVVAEGVETHEQMSMLKQLGCEYAQGYFFSRPIIAAAAEQMIRIQTTI